MTATAYENESCETAPDRAELDRLLMAFYQVMIDRLEQVGCSVGSEGARAR